MLDEQLAAQLRVDVADHGGAVLAEVALGSAGLSTGVAGGVEVVEGRHAGTTGVVESRALRASEKDWVNWPLVSWWVTEVT